MKDQLISFETAKLAKKKGFNIRVVPRYGKGKSEKKIRLYESNSDYDSECNIEWDWNNNSDNGIISPYPNEELKEQCSAPTQSLLQRWLREKHNVYFWMSPVTFRGAFCYYKLQVAIPNMLWDKPIEIIGQRKETYEEILEKGLLQALEIIKSVGD